MSVDDAGWDGRIHLLVAAAVAGWAPVIDRQRPWLAAVPLTGLALWILLARRPWRPILLRAGLLASGLLWLPLLAPLRAGVEPGPALVVGLTHLLRGLVIGLAAIVLFSVAPWPELLGLLQRWRAPKGLIMLLTIQLGQLGSLARSVRRTRRALRLRLPQRGLRRQLLAGRAALSRLLPESLVRAERIAWSLELRGWNGRLLMVGPWRPRRSEGPGLVLGLGLLIGLGVAAWT